MQNSKIDDFISAIEGIEDQRKELLEEKNAILAQAEQAGYPKTVIRAILKRRKNEDRQAVLDEDRQLYATEREMGMEVLSPADLEMLD